MAREFGTSDVNRGEAPAIVLVAWSLAAGVVTGGVAWWALGDTTVWGAPVVGATTALVAGALGGWLQRTRVGPALRRAQENADALVDAALARDRAQAQLRDLPIPVMEIDREYNVRFLNAVGAGLVGETPASALGKKCHSLFRTAHCRTPDCALERAMRSGRIETAETYANPPGCSSPIPIRYSGLPSRDPRGAIDGALEAVIDLSAVYAVVGDLRQVSGVLGSSSEELSTTSSELTAQASASARSAESATASVGDIAARLGGVSTATDGLAAEVATVSAAVEELSASLEEVARSTGETAGVAARVESQSAQARERMDALNDVARRVGRIVDLITDIADQTKLLALNATIEAANSGSAGAGFAVVAREIKELARQTTDGAAEIRTQVAEIVGNTNETSAAMDQVATATQELNRFIQSVAAAVEEQSAAVREVASAVSRASGRTAEIAVDVSRSSSGTREALAAIQSANATVQQTTTAVEEMGRGAAELARLAARLNETTARFTLQ